MIIIQNETILVTEIKKNVLKVLIIFKSKVWSKSELSFEFRVCVGNIIEERGGEADPEVHPSFLR